MVLIFEYLSLFVFSSLTAIFIGLYFYFTRNFKFWQKLGIPYATPKPFFGNLKDCVFQKVGMGKNLQQIYGDHSDKPYVGIFSFDKPSLLIRDLELVKNILVKESHSFIDNMVTINAELEPLFGRGLLVLKGQMWRQVRTSLNPVFTSGKMKTIFHLVDICGKELADYLEKAIAEGSPVDVKETMARFTTDVIASCAFGINSNSLKDPDAEFRKHLKRIFEFTVRKGLAVLTSFFAPYLSTVFKLKFLDEVTTNYVRKTVWNTVEYREGLLAPRPTPSWRTTPRRLSATAYSIYSQLPPLIGGRFSIRNLRTRHAVVTGNSEGEAWSGAERFFGLLNRAEKQGNKSIQDNMLPAKNTKTSSTLQFDGDLFLGQAFFFLAAGFETSGSTISYALYELALHPEIQHRLRDEIIRVLNKHNGQLTYDDIQEMAYLDMVVSETLREYPAVPFLDRMCCTDYKLPAPTGNGTITLPAGTGIYIPILGLHHDPKYFPEPETFDPDRFTEENKRSRPNYTYIPFGEGPRICIGMRFGQMQVKIGLCHILSRFKVEPCKDKPVPITFKTKPFLLLMNGDLPLSFDRR